MFKQISHSASLYYIFFVFSIFDTYYAHVPLLFTISFISIDAKADLLPWSVFYLLSVFVCCTYDIYFYLLFYWLIFFYFQKLAAEYNVRIPPFLFSLFLYVFLHHELASKRKCLNFFLCTFKLNSKIKLLIADVKEEERFGVEEWFAYVRRITIRVVEKEQ